MTRQRRGLTRREMLSASAVGLSTIAGAAGVSAQGDPPLGAGGLWRYVSLGRTTGEELKLDGLFVFQNGRFVQQALNSGELLPMAQAHAGTYTIEKGKIILNAEVGLIVTPTASTPVASTPNRRHELTPVRDDDRLTLTFGSGTIQKFVRVGNGRGRVVPLTRGALALVNDHFLLVFEDADRAIAGSGRYWMKDAAIRFMPERWLTAKGGKAVYSTAPVDATLSGSELKIVGESPMQVHVPTEKKDPFGS